MDVFVQSLIEAVASLALFCGVTGLFFLVGLCIGHARYDSHSKD